MPQPDASSGASSGVDAAALRERTDAQLLADCSWEAFRASGPGGQKRNKTSSAIRLTHRPTALSAIANESRSQAKNRASALRRLRHRMMLSLRAPVELTAFTMPAWTRALPAGGRLDLSPRHEQYLPLAGLVLDVLAAAGWSVSDAAGRLGVSTGNLVRFLQHDEPMLAHVNQARAAAGLKALGSRD